MADFTTQQLIKLALRKIGAIATGETPTADELNEALESLKALLRLWSSEGLYVFVIEEDTHTLSAGTQSYTIGSGATIDTTRPVDIVRAYVTNGGLDNPLTIIGEKQYLELAQKELGSNEPSLLWYLPGYSTGTVYLWPPGGGVLHIWSHKPLTEPAGLTADVAFPGVYDQAIIWNLACDLAPEYGRDPSPYMLLRALDAKGHIVGINMGLSMNTVKPEMLKLTRRYHIDHG